MSDIRALRSAAPLKQSMITEYQTWAKGPDIAGAPDRASWGPCWGFYMVSVAAARVAMGHRRVGCRE